MKVLIYEPLPDINRGKFISAFAHCLVSAGFEVEILLEKSLIYTERQKITSKGVLHNNCVIAHYFHGLPVRFVDIPNKLYKNVNQYNLNTKLNEVSDYRRTFFEEFFTCFVPNRVFIWNGAHDYQQDFIDYCASRKLYTKLVFAELAWFSQKDYFYLDTIGVNGRSSISMHKFKSLATDETRKISNWIKSFKSQLNGHVTEKKTVLVPLQLESDTSITEFSPFSTMLEFLKFLDHWLPEEFTIFVRNHPLAQNNEVLSSMPSRFSISPDESLYDAIDKAEYVVGINSTVLLESLAFGKKVYAFGRGIFSSSNAIFSNNNLDRKFQTFEPNEADMQCFLYELVFSRQIPFREVYDMNARYLISVLPFDVRLPQKVNMPKLYNPNLFDRLLGYVFYHLFFMKQRIQRWI